jgi:hypothetical protein
VLAAVGGVPSAAEAVNPRPPQPQPLAVVAALAIVAAALVATDRRRERGSAVRPWGTGSTSTRGPPALQPA